MPTRFSPWLRWTCIAALALGLAGLGGAYWLTLHIQTVGLTHPDPAHGLNGPSATSVPRRTASNDPIPILWYGRV